MATQFGGWGVPGAGAQDITTEKNLLWGYGAENGLALLFNGILSGTARDNGNTPTNVCRPGLTLGIISASNKWAQYNPAATDGTQQAAGFLKYDTLTEDFTGTNSDRVITILVGGPIKTAQLIGLDYQARSQLARQFIFDDDLPGYRNPAAFPSIQAANYTCLLTDCGKTFYTTGATGTVTFTLPAVAGANGWYARFVNTVAQTMAVTSAEGTNIMTFDNAGASTLTFSTSANLYGAILDIWSNGTLWFMDYPCKNTLTIS